MWWWTELNIHQQLFKEQCGHINNLLLSTKQDYFQIQIAGCKRNQKKLYWLTWKLLGDDGTVILPTHAFSANLTEKVSQFSHQRSTTSATASSITASATKNSVATPTAQSVLSVVIHLLGSPQLLRRKSRRCSPVPKTSHVSRTRQQHGSSRHALCNSLPSWQPLSTSRCRHRMSLLAIRQQW